MTSTAVVAAAAEEAEVLLSRCYGGGYGGGDGN